MESPFSAKHLSNISTIYRNPVACHSLKCLCTDEIFLDIIVCQKCQTFTVNDVMLAKKRNKAKTDKKEFMLNNFFCSSPHKLFMLMTQFFFLNKNSCLKSFSDFESAFVSDDEVNQCNQMPTSTWWTLELFYTRRKTTQLNKLNQIEFSFQDAFCEKDFFFTFIVVSAQVPYFLLYDIFRFYILQGFSNRLLFV